MPQLLLASASPARLATLQRAGVEPLVRASNVDEEEELRTASQRFGSLSAPEEALVLARAKAEAVAQQRQAEALPRERSTETLAQQREAEGPPREPAGGLPREPAGRLPSKPAGDHADADFDADVVILGCDSILEFAGHSWGKPADAAQARARWLQMAGNSGVLHTGHWLIDEATGRMTGASTATEVHFAALTEAEIDAYLETEEPLNVAGAFTIDGHGGWFIERIVGDHHTVVGVSLPLLRKLLADIGISVVDLWR